MLKRSKILIACIMSLSILSGCGDKDGISVLNVNEPKVTFLNSRDISNSVSSSDIYVEFIVNVADLEEIRIVVIPSALSIDLTKEVIENLPSTRTDIIIPDGSTNFGTRLDDIKDIAGNELVNDEEYSIQLVLIKTGSLYISPRTTSITLSNIHPLIGTYTGKRNDNVFSSFDIGLKINSYTNGVLSGEMFYNSDFVACCNGELVGATNDGEVTLVTSDIENTINSFHYFQDLPTLGDGCEGEFLGTGEYDEFSFELSISYEGNDCDEDNYAGTYVFNRIFE